MKRARTRLPAVAEGAFRLLAAIAAEHQALTQRIAVAAAGAWRGSPPRCGAARRARLSRVLRARRRGRSSPTCRATSTALDRRLAKYAENPARDARHAATIGRVVAALPRAPASANRAAGRVEPALDEFRWLLEELAVSLFAQELKTPFPVSYKRLEKAWAALGR